MCLIKGGEKNILFTTFSVCSKKFCRNIYIHWDYNLHKQAHKNESVLRGPGCNLQWFNTAESELLISQVKCSSSSNIRFRIYDWDSMHPCFMVVLQWSARIILKLNCNVYMLVVVATTQVYMHMNRSDVSSAQNSCMKI